MKAISLWQPWASLWCSPAKEHETRHWPTSHRGWLAVHGAKRFEKDFDGDPLAIIINDEFGHDWQKTLPRGALIGLVEIVRCEKTETVMLEWGCPPEPVPMMHWADYHCGDFSTGRYGWQRGKFIRFAEPIPYRGIQGIFHVPDDLVGAVLSNQLDMGV
jgi:activating signal cointegrator 1